MLTIIVINKSGEFSINSLDDISEEKISLNNLVAKILARISFYPDEKIIIKGHISSAHNLATDLILSLNKSHLRSHYYYLTSNTKETSPDIKRYSGLKVLSFADLGYMEIGNITI